MTSQLIRHKIEILLREDLHGVLIFITLFNDDVLKDGITVNSRILVDFSSI